MTVRVHRATHGTYWRWTCDTCDLWDSAGDWDNAMEAATGHVVYRHAWAIQQRRDMGRWWRHHDERSRRMHELIDKAFRHHRRDPLGACRIRQS